MLESTGQPICPELLCTMIAKFYWIAVALSVGLLLCAVRGQDELCAVRGEVELGHKDHSKASPAEALPIETKTPSRPKATDKDFLYGKRKVKDWYINDACRRFPLWLGKLRDSCIKYTGWAPQRPWWWLDEAHETLGSKRGQMENCIERDFLEYMKTWPE